MMLGSSIPEIRGKDYELDKYLITLYKGSATRERCKFSKQLSSV